MLQHLLLVYKEPLKILITLFGLNSIGTLPKAKVNPSIQYCKILYKTYQHIELLGIFTI